MLLKEEEWGLEILELFVWEIPPVTEATTQIGKESRNAPPTYDRRKASQFTHMKYIHESSHTHEGAT